MEKKLLVVFIKKNCKKLTKKNIELKKGLKRKQINYMSNGKDITILLITGLIKKYFPPYRSSGSNIKVELDLSSYATKNDLKNVTHVDVSSFASKTSLASLNTEVDKIDFDKLKTVPVDLVKLSNIVKNDVVKETEYNKLVTKVDNIDTTRFVLKTTYDGDKSDLEKKISDTDKKVPDTSDLTKNRFKC